MKKSLLILSVVLFLLEACSTQKKATTPKQETTFVKDSIEFYETDFEVRQKNYLNLLLGKWMMQSMKRQSAMAEEELKNTSITFRADSTFVGEGGCNHISGRYILKGTSIKFSNIISTKMACDNLDAETAFLKLLQETVSAYSVTATDLLLRDGSSNIIFKGKK